MIRTFLALLFAIAYCVIGSPGLLYQNQLHKKNPEKSDIQSLHMVQWAFRVIYKLCGVRVTVKGKENIPQGQAVLYAANHNSYFDIIIGYTLCDNLTGFIAKDSIGKVPFLRGWMIRLHCLFMDRKDVKQSLKIIKDSAQMIRDGISVWIFPEGTRGESEEMLEFKEGSFKMAERTGCPVVPVAITNTRYIIKNNIPLLHHTNVEFEFCEPIYPKELPKEERKTLGAKSRAAIAEKTKKNAVP